MKSEKTYCLSLLMSMIFLFGFVGFGFADSETVELKYETGGLESIPCSKSVSVITFEDKRKDAAIGESGKGKKFHGKNPVGEWVSRALYDELKSVGCNVEYHDTAGNYNTDVTITGAVEEAYIKQDSMTKYNVNMRLHLDITQGKEIIGKTYRSSMTKRSAPSFSFNSAVATQLLQDVMKAAVADLGDILK